MRILTVLLICLAIPALAHSTILEVPPYPTIQDAIDAAVDGDTVLVHPGTYLENIDFKGKAITVMSSGGADVTVIDGNKAGSVVTFNTFEKTNSVITGFTIKNGVGTYYAVYSYYLGGGILCDNSSPTITGNIITKNECTSNMTGAGICCINTASPEIRDNLIIMNKIDGNGSGGGICCAFNSSPNIQDNIINDNIISGSPPADGGGIASTEDSSPSIISNTICGNSVMYGDGGGLSIVWYCKIEEMKDNIIEDNIAKRGGGIYCDRYVDIKMINNIIALNKATQDSGGGICAFDSNMKIYNTNIIHNASGKSGGGFWAKTCNITVANSIIWGNDAFNVGSQICLEKDNTLDISFSDLQYGYSGIYNGSNNNIIWGLGMIDADPLLVDPSNGKFHLTWLSPCINRATNNGAPSEDFEGDPRPWMGTVDMGADEFIGDHALGADIFSLSEAQGGKVNFTLFGGADNGGRNYLLIGSVTGTTPGTPLPGNKATLPLNWDLFSNLVIAHLNGPVFMNFMGSLSFGSSTAQATFDTFGPIPGALGFSFNFAYALNKPWDFVSNPVAIEITP